MSSRTRAEQRDDIATWFKSIPGLIFSAVVLGGFGIWLAVSFIVDLVTAGTGS